MPAIQRNIGAKNSKGDILCFIDSDAYPADDWIEKGLPIVIVNPSTPIGEGDLKPTATGQMIVDFLNRKTPAYVDTGLNLVDVRDVALGHVRAAEKGRVGEKYILGNRDMSLREIYQTLGSLTGLPAPKVKVPHWLPLAWAALDTGVSRLVGRTPGVPLEAVRLSRYKMYFDASKAVRELGLPFLRLNWCPCHLVACDDNIAPALVHFHIASSASFTDW